MYVIVAILIFGVLIFVHELGHFLTAKACDVQVNEFAICMGPAIVKKEVGETTYSLRCIPIGGYCAMEGEDEESENPRAFTSKVWWKRLLVLVAGSAMNFLAGFLIIVILYASASGFLTSEVTGFFDDGRLESQGLQVGDELYKIDGKRVYIYSDVSLLLGRNDTEHYDLIVRRDGQTVELNDFWLELRELELDGEKQEKYGILFGGSVDNSFGTLMQYAWNTSLDYARMVWMSLGDLLKGLVSVKDMSGPVGIVSTIAETGNSAPTVADGMRNVATLGAFIAINLAVMNMLPIPALDGGRVFLLLISTAFTAIFKKKIPSKYEAYIHAAGMVLLLAFMAFVTLKDIWTLVF